MSSQMVSGVQIHPLRPGIGAALPGFVGASAGSDMEVLLARAGGARRRVRRGEYLYRLGAAFHALYGIRAGSFKSVLLTDHVCSPTGAPAAHAEVVAAKTSVAATKSSVTPCIDRRTLGPAKVR